MSTPPHFGLQLPEITKKQSHFCNCLTFNHYPCDSGATRTRDPQLRRLLLYPTELRNRAFARKAACNKTANIRIIHKKQCAFPTRTCTCVCLQLCLPVPASACSHTGSSACVFPHMCLSRVLSVVIVRVAVVSAPTSTSVL